MSFYSYNEGTITFKTKEGYDKIYELLCEHGYYSKKHNSYLEEGMEECPLNDGTGFNPKDLTLTFPQGTMRNFTRWFKELDTVEWEGTITGYSTDGCFDGWIITPSGEKNYDLEDYATRKGLDQAGPDHAEFFEYVEDIFDDWKADPDWQINSVKYIKEA